MFADLREARSPTLWRSSTASPPTASIGEMDCFYAAWMTDRPNGFSDDDVAALQRLTPFLGLAIKAASLARIAETLVETYLGRDAGRRVLHGQIARGVADRIKAVLWFSDLRNYTRISDTSPPEQIIPLLNDYADAVVSAIHQNSGDVLKLIGDGVLAIFPAEERARACAAALTAAKEARAAVEALNARRTAEGLPATDMYLGLHLGVVFYGNIGSKERLDFTVVGPAVNEVSRIAAMCRSVDQPILISSAFVESVQGQAPAVRLGRPVCAARRRQAAGTLHARRRTVGPSPACSTVCTHLGGGCHRTDDWRPRPPCGGGIGWGVALNFPYEGWKERQTSQFGATPLLNPPPQGGRKSRANLPTED